MRGALPAAIALLLTTPAWADELAGIALPDRVTVEGRTLTLNGMGAREATIFRVKVYVAGLYLEAPSSDPDAILGSRGIKRLVMTFARAVGRKRIVEGWDESFEECAGKAMPGLRARVLTLDSWMPDMARDGSLAFTEIPGRGMRVEVNGQERGILPGTDFAETFWRIWLGAGPPSPELKAGLLGRGAGR